MARREGFTVERATCADADGFTTWRNRKIRIRPDATDGEAVTALAHQLGHVLLHSHIAGLEPSGTVPCRGIRKVEADSVAYLTAAQLGLDTTTITFPHVSSWAGTDPRARPADTIKTVTSHVLAASRRSSRPRLDAAGITGQQTAARTRHRSPDSGRPARRAIRSRHGRDRPRPRQRRHVLPRPDARQLGSGLPGHPRADPRRPGAMASRIRTRRHGTR